MSIEEVENVESSAGDAAETAVETLAAKRYPVAPDCRLNVRTGPGTNYRIARVLPYGASVMINCQRPGTTETGPYGTSNLWDNIGNGEYVSDAFIHTGSDGYVAVRCG